ncbi:hypothetical protein MMC29_001446 [Sticta canariensis]|nr:hypothetical protein [Sticta canariensis]
MKNIASSIRLFWGLEREPIGAREVPSLKTDTQTRESLARSDGHKAALTHNNRCNQETKKTKINHVGGSFSLQIVLGHKLTSKIEVPRTHPDTLPLDILVVDDREELRGPALKTGSPGEPRELSAAILQV